MTYQNSHSSGEIGSVSMALPLLGQIEIIVIIQFIGFNVGINAGASAGQTVYHVHLIPDVIQKSYTRCSNAGFDVFAAVHNVQNMFHAYTVEP